MSSAWRHSLNRISEYSHSRGSYRSTPSQTPNIESPALPNPYDPADVDDIMETGAYQVGPPPAHQARSSVSGHQMESNRSGSSSGKHRPVLTIPQLTKDAGPASSGSHENEKKADGDSPDTPATTLAHGYGVAQSGPQQPVGHNHNQSVSTTIAGRSANRMSRYSQAAPSERTRIVSSLYQHWPERPEPITAILSIWQHILWVFGPLIVVAGAGAIGLFVCLHLSVSSAAWMVYIFAYFLVSFVFLGIVGHEMRVFSERKWRKTLAKVTINDIGLMQDRRPDAEPDLNGRLSSDGQNYQIGDADETMATEAGEAYALMESNTNANRRQSVAFKTPEKPSPIKETQDAAECYVPTYTYNGYGAVATASPSRKTQVRASRVFQQVQRSADYVANAAQSATEWSGAATQRSSTQVPSPVNIETPSSAVTANGHSGRAGVGALNGMYVEPAYASPIEDISMERMYSSGRDRPQSYHMTDKEMVIDFANEKGKVVASEASPAEASRQIFNGDRYGMGHYHGHHNGEKLSRGNSEVYAKV